MSLFELQSWLGHRSPVSTQYSVRISPTKLTKAYRDAGYFARNVRAIKVLIDREAIAAGAAAGGQPWQYFDFGQMPRSSIRRDQGQDVGARKLGHPAGASPF